MKEQSEIIKRTADHAAHLLSGEHTGHDWWHVYRVWQNAIYIGRDEKADMLVVELAALLHDIADWKFHGGDEKAGSRAAREWLTSQSVNITIIDHVCQIIDDLSFKGAAVRTAMKTKEGMVVQDADRLDALGAIGIARAFAYGGHKGREIYNPAISPTHHQSFEEYKKSAGTTINHFHEKLLLLKDLMNTQTGRELAEQRHEYLLSFLERFRLEWEGKA
jgi:uncharacterized protein